MRCVTRYRALGRVPRLVFVGCRGMSSAPHVERTAGEPRGETFHLLRISQITHPNSSIRRLQLKPSPLQSPPRHFQEPGIVLSPTLPPFKPGQWVDFHAPSVSKVGGFTITSAPHVPYLELAIQRAKGNPVAEWLWRDEMDVLGQDVKVKVGGAFVWPPKGYDEAGKAMPETVQDIHSGFNNESRKTLRQVVFVAGGVGINPLMAILSHLVKLRQTKGGRLGFKIVLLYGSKYVPTSDGEILFLSRLKDVFRQFGDEGHMKLFITGRSEQEEVDDNEVEMERRRMAETDLESVLGEASERAGVVCYVCGVPSMTDWAVDVLAKADRMSEESVLCEKWW